MNVNCRTNYKKCPKDVKNNNKNRAGHASEPGTDKCTVPDSRSVSGSAIDSFMIFLQCYVVKMPDFIDILLDGSVGCELA